MARAAVTFDANRFRFRRRRNCASQVECQVDLFTRQDWPDLVIRSKFPVVDADAYLSDPDSLDNAIRPILEFDAISGDVSL